MSTQKPARRCLPQLHPKLPELGRNQDVLQEVMEMSAVVHPDKRNVIPVLKRNETSSREETWANTKCLSLRGRSQSQKAPYCVIPTMTFWRKQNHGDSKKISSRQVLAGWVGWQSTETFQGRETTVCDITMVDTVIICLLKPTRCAALTALM